VSRPSSRPGPQSLVALRWLTRLGASPGEPLALVMNWTQPGLYDHVARLTHAGLVRRVPMTRGDGSLLVVTPDGARMGGASAGAAPRGVAPTTWAHVVACAWTAAWFDVRGRDWLSGREVGADEAWRGEVVYQDGYGRKQRQRHRPDLATFIRNEPGLPVAVEVELQRKSTARLRGILAMYAARTAEPGAQLAGVVYVTGPANVNKAVRAAAEASGLTEHSEDSAAKLRMLALDDVIAETRDVAARNRESLRHPAADGHVFAIGATGSGTTTGTLRVANS